jgi:predicted anti-sigma-YlaC factor YlaD
MTCRQVIEFLDRYCDGELTALQRARFKVHLSLCRNCRRYLASYRATIRLSRDASGPPPEVPEELIQAILASVRRERD